MSFYPHRQIEAKWQKIWTGKKFAIWHPAPESSSMWGRRPKPSTLKPKTYVLDMFPYPSGSGLHVGHPLGYIGSDIVARYLRMRGCNVLHPMGWDAFGLPAEIYAIKNKIHPAKAVARNIKNFKKQLLALGLSYDWQREINTTDPNYYKWTQWIFLEMFRKGLAYEAETPVNWCPSCRTILANEEVVAGRCERCDTLVERKNIRQWLLKITAYADSLLKDLDDLDWPEKVKEMQRNWIGRSEGREIDFFLRNAEGKIRVFTTRPDTIDGATYLVLAPEHELVNRFLKAKIKISNHKEAARYVEEALRRGERERLTVGKEKTGVEIKGIKAVNPWNKETLPVWVADYVLASYGTGAIMAVPAHDLRDREFAEKFGLPIKQAPLLGPRQVNLLGEKRVNYKLRDWIFSRQRYWGEPIPIIKCPDCGNVPVPEKDLPVKLPPVKKYQPTGEAESPLASIEKWVKVRCPKCRSWGRRETHTMPQWAGSCWYYIGYLQSGKFWNKKILDYWLPVDLYVGGVEHAVLHLLYARFWHKFLYDIGVVGSREPFQKLVNQGLILGPDGQKMSKSRGNIISPDSLIKDFGADALRLYEMFMGPFGDSKPWDPRGIVGTHRFLNRIYQLFKNQNPQSPNPKFRQTPNPKIRTLLHQTIKKVTEDIENFRFNTAVSALMILVNELEKTPQLEIAEKVIKLLFPFAPHLAQELWQRLGKKTLLDKESWPSYDEALLKVEKIIIIISVDGRPRDKIIIEGGTSEAETAELARRQPAVKRWLLGKKIKRTVFVPGRLINFVTS